MMTKSATRILSAAVLLGLVAAAIEPAAASSSPPVTLRGTGTTSGSSADGNGPADESSIVLRGSTPPPTPSFAGFPCPPGYTYSPDTGCIVSGDGSGYGSEPDYDWWYWPYDFGGRRSFRPHRHAARGFSRSGFAHGAGFEGMPVAHGFGGGHR